MRIATLIISLLLGLLMFLLTMLVYGLLNAANDTESSDAGAVGVGMALLWLVGAAFVLPFPLLSTVVFALAGVMGLAASSEFADLGIWGGVSFVLAVMAFAGAASARRRGSEWQSRCGRPSVMRCWRGWCRRRSASRMLAPANNAAPATTPT